MKKILFLMLCMLPLSYLHAKDLPYDVLVDNFGYKIAEEGASVSYIENKSSLSSVQLPENVTYQDVSYPVIAIEAGAFSQTGLTRIVLPPLLKKIGDAAFEYCSNLENVAFPTSLEEIGMNAFRECKSLEKADLPHSVFKMGDAAFSGCTALASVIVPSSLKNIPNSAFSSCSFKTIELHDGLESIGEKAFYNCSELQSIKVPDGVSHIGGAAFAYCLQLTSVFIPKSVTFIGEISRDFTSLFTRDDRLKEVVVEDSNPVYDSRDNCVGIIETATNTLLFACRNTIIPNTIGTIGEKAFSYAGSKFSYIEPDVFVENFTIKIPDSVKKIGDNAFYHCNYMDNIVLPNSVTEMGENVFYYCEQLRSIVIGENVPSLVYCFRECSNLKDIYCFPTTPPRLAEPSDNIGIYEWEHTYNRPFLHVKNGYKDAYEQTEWSFCYIVEDLTDGIAQIHDSQSIMPNEEGTLYDLSGRQMVNGKWLNGKLQKGIYIQNGKKVVLK